MFMCLVRKGWAGTSMQSHTYLLNVPDEVKVGEFPANSGFPVNMGLWINNHGVL